MHPSPPGVPCGGEVHPHQGGPVDTEAVPALVSSRVGVLGFRGGGGGAPPVGSGGRVAPQAARDRASTRVSRMAVNFSWENLLSIGLQGDILRNIPGRKPRISWWVIRL